VNSLPLSPAAWSRLRLRTGHFVLHPPPSQLRHQIRFPGYRTRCSTGPSAGPRYTFEPTPSSPSPRCDPQRDAPRIEARWLSWVVCSALFRSPTPRHGHPILGSVYPRLRETDNLHLPDRWRLGPSTLDSPNTAEPVETANRAQANGDELSEETTTSPFAGRV